MLTSNVCNIKGRVSSESNINEVSSLSYLGNMRELNIHYDINLVSDMNLVASNLTSIISIKVLEDGIIIYNSTREISLKSDSYIPVDINLIASNTQTEEHLFILQLDDASHNIEYTELKDNISIEPTDNNGKQSLILSYKQVGTVFHISFYAAKPVDKVYCKINNNDWKEITGGFDINNNELEGRINYIQIYTKDNNGKFIYSNPIMLIKM